MLQAMRGASVAFGVDYVNKGVAGFRFGAPNRIDAVVLDSGAEVFAGWVVNAAGVSFCKRAELARASECGKSWS